MESAASAKPRHPRIATVVGLSNGVHSAYPRQIDGRPARSRLSRSVLRLAMLAAPLALAACQTTPPPETIAPVPPQSFVRGWTASTGSKSPLTGMYLVDDQLYALSKDNQAFVFSGAGGRVIYNDQIAEIGSAVRPPIALPDNRVVYPTSDALVEYDKPGKRLGVISLAGKTTTSPGISLGNIVFIGLAGTTGGRLAALDLQPNQPTAEQVANARKLKIPLTNELTHLTTKWEVYTGSAIEGTPAVFQGAVYAGASDGQVWAVNESGNGLWELPDGSHTFQAAGPIRCDLKVDDAGVYVASLDGKLYCLDRGSGRVKWTYFAAGPLDQPPVLGPNTIYQPVPTMGLVAIDKRSAGIAKAKWLNPDAVRYLCEDDKLVYVLKKNGGLMALDKTTGLRQFESKKHDLQLFVADGKTVTIFGGTDAGMLESIKPVLMPGVVGIQE